MDPRRARAGAATPHGPSEARRGGTAFILSPREEPLHVETLTMIAQYPLDRGNPLSVGAIVPLGRPWLGKADADHLLVFLPCTLGPRFQHLAHTQGHVQILWLVPITAAEAGFARAHGVEALEDRLERSRVDVIAPNRPDAALEA